MDNLKACPFCGGKAISGGITMKFMGKDQPKTYGVMCDNDNCLIQPYMVDSKDTESEAINAWNRRADGWRPIETAPKVNKKSLLLARAGGWVCQGFWCEFDQVWHTDYTLGRTGAGDGIVPPPTHFMPLPTPPESEGSDE